MVNIPPLGFSFESKISFEALESIVEALESIFYVGFAFFDVFQLGLAGNKDIHLR
jgi:hypothetical protein